MYGEMSADHITAWSRGGVTSIDNSQTLWERLCRNRASERRQNAAENGRRKIRVKIFWCNGLKCVPLQADYVQKTSIGRSPAALLAECRRWL